MPRTTVSPFRTAPDALDFGPWHVQQCQEALPLAELPPWDYLTELVLGCDVRVDVAAAQSECRLPAVGTELAVVAVAECSEAYWRASNVFPVTSERTRLTIPIPAGTVAGVVRLRRRLVVARTTISPDPLIPGRGHIIGGARDRTTVVLEGDGGRFPTRALSFAVEGLPQHAPWHLTLSYDDPEDSFAGSVELLLNTDHPRVAELVGEAADAVGHASIQGHLSFDIARQLVMQAVRETRLDSRTTWEDDSVGGVLEALCARTSGGSAQGCRTANSQDPQSFDTALKAELGFLS